MQKNSLQVLEQLLAWLKFQRESGADLVSKDVIARMEHLEMSLKKKKTVHRANTKNLSSVKNLSSLQSIVEKCRLCPLSETRNRVVFGEGDSNALLMLIGEAPGREEDLKGRPFVGRSGELLTKMLRAINIERQEVFITSVIKCRPPGNRTPSREEIAACLPFLEKQIEFVSPGLILCLGATAASSLLGTSASLSSLRQKFHEYNGIKVVVTYHPAYLLRFGGMKQRDLKKKAWHDLQMLQKEYEKLRETSK